MKLFPRHSVANAMTENHQISCSGNHECVHVSVCVCIVFNGPHVQSEVAIPILPDPDDKQEAHNAQDYTKPHHTHKQTRQMPAPVYSLLCWKSTRKCVSSIVICF